MKQLFGLLLLVGFIGAYFWQIAAVVAAVLALRRAWTGYQQARDEFTADRAAEAAERRRLIASADREHAAVMAGDDYGVFGRFPPNETH